MMAIAALSLAQQGNTERVDALQHYDQSTSALQSIQSAEDLSSDGAFLTHFLLLVYEVCLVVAFLDYANGHRLLLRRPVILTCGHTISPHSYKYQSCDARSTKVKDIHS